LAWPELFGYIGDFREVDVTGELLPSLDPFELAPITEGFVCSTSASIGHRGRLRQ